MENEHDEALKVLEEAGMLPVIEVEDLPLSFRGQDTLLLSG